MNSFKRYLKKTLALVLTFIFFTTNVFASFSDMNDHWGKQYVDDLYREGVTQGYEDGTFRPDGSITVGEFAALLDRYYYGSQGGFDRTGTDPSTWMDGHISFLEREGILFNYGSKNSNLTRIVALRIIISAIEGANEKLVDNNIPRFTDNHLINYNDYKYINLGIQNGVIQGYPDGTFQPDRIVTRAEAAKMLFTMKYHPELEIKKPSGGSGGEEEKPKGEWIKAKVVFTYPQELNDPIYITREQYEANEEMTIETPISADGSEWRNVRMGMFWMFGNVDEKEIEKLELSRSDHKNLPDTDENCFKFITLKGSTTNTRPELLDDTWTRGTFKFTPQNPVIKAVAYMRGSMEEDKSVAVATYRLNIIVEGEEPSNPGTGDGDNSNGGGNNGDNNGGNNGGGDTTYSKPYTEITVPNPFYPKQASNNKTITWSYISDDNIPYKHSIVSLYKYVNGVKQAVFTDKIQTDRQLIVEGDEKEVYEIEVKVVDEKDNESRLKNNKFTIISAGISIDLELDTSKEGILGIAVYNRTSAETEALFPTSYTTWKIENDKGEIILQGTGKAPGSVTLDEKFEGGIFKVTQYAENTLGNTAYATSEFGIQSYLNFEINPNLLFENELATVLNKSKNIKNEVWEIKEEKDSQFNLLTLNNNKFSKEAGFYKVKLTGEGFFGAEYGKRSVIRDVVFLSTKPNATLTIGGNTKMYKEITLDGSESIKATDARLQQKHPIQFSNEKTQFIVMPITEENGSIDITRSHFILGKGKEVIDGKVAFKGKEKQSIRIDKDGWYRVQYKVYNGVKESDWYTRDFYVSPELNIDVNIEIDKSVVYRNPEDALKSELKVMVNYSSPDDYLDEEKSILYISYDRNEDKDFSNDDQDSTQYVTKNSNRLKEYISLVKTDFLQNRVVYTFKVDNLDKNHFGNFKFDFLAVEKPKIPNFNELGQAPIMQNGTFSIEDKNKIILIDNVKPVIHLETLKQNRVEIWIIQESEHEVDVNTILQQLDTNRIKAKLYIIKENGTVEIMEN